MKMSVDICLNFTNTQLARLANPREQRFASVNDV